jgi:hypothetical protein
LNLLEDLYNELKGEMFAKIKDSVLEDLKPVICDLIRQAAKEIKSKDEYQLAEWFIQKYKISKKTFFKYKKLGFVHSKQVGRNKIYNIKQWVENLDKIKTGKPNFLKVTR